MGICSNIEMWTNCLLLLALPLLCLGGGQVPRIARTSPPQVKTVGEAVELDCIIENIDEFTQIWRRSDVILSVQTLLVTLNKRYRVKVKEPSVDERETVYTLQIDDAQESDTGRYQCQISSQGSVPVEIDLTVLAKPLD